MSRSGAQAFYAQLSDKFNSGNINNLFGLDQFPPGDTEALVLASKMSLMQINLLQQLIMAGSTRGENTTLRSFAGTAANWMQVSGGEGGRRVDCVLWCGGGRGHVLGHRAGQQHSRQGRGHTAGGHVDGRGTSNECGPCSHHAACL
jgi:hypothetical protein